MLVYDDISELHRGLYREDQRRVCSMSDSVGNVWALGGAVTFIFATAASAVLIIVLFPWLRRYALARPNARSSHRTPTPQGGGIAVIAATMGAVGVALGFFSLGVSPDSPLPMIIAVSVLMACVGAIDDIRPLAVGPRLLLQAVAVAVVIYAVPDHLRVIPLLPWWVERILLLIGGLVVRQSGQFHGWYRLDDRRRGDTADGDHGRRRDGRRASALWHRRRACTLRRHDRLCLFQSSNCETSFLAMLAVFPLALFSVGFCSCSPAAATWSPRW